MYKTRNLPNTRIDVADALRGIAVAGIIIYHSVEHFNIFTTEPISYTLACDDVVGRIMAWLLSGKMYGIFALLFGLSFFIMNDNQQQKQRSFSLRFAWRMSLLWGFGIINLLLYDGDILMIYALLGLMLIPISYLPSAVVWCIVGVLAIQPVEIYRLCSGWFLDGSEVWALAGSIGEAHMHGSFIENMSSNLQNGFFFNILYFVYSGRMTQILCLFILGMQLGRHRLFYDEHDHLHYWHIVLGASTVLVLALSLVDFGALELWLSPIYNLMILCMITSAVVSAWYAFAGVRKALQHLCVFGRMSLTNYLLQSLFGSVIFCGFGLAMYRHVGITYATLIGLAMVVGQYFFCRYWFKNHDRGPFEALWRRFTWIRIKC